jgi:hypothetical protein
MAQVVGSNNSGVTNNYSGAGGYIYPTATQAVGTSPVLRAFVGHVRNRPTLRLAVYENDVNDLSTATLLEFVTILPFRNYNDPQYIDVIEEVNIALTSSKYYWLGVFHDADFYVASGSGTAWVSVDSYDPVSNPDPVALVGTTSTTGEKYNLYAEIVDSAEKATVVIGATPDSGDYSLLRSNVAYQQQGAQIRHDKYSTNLKDVTVFDTGRFLISGGTSDSFNYAIAAPSQAFSAEATATIKDVTLEEIA